MPRRATPQHAGLSYFDANRNCLVEVSGECLEYKRQIQERWPGVIDCWFDKDRLHFVVTVKDIHGKESMLFNTDRLNESTIERIQRAQDITPEELIADIDNHNAEIEADQDRRFSDQIGDFGERFMHALKKDGFDADGDIWGVRNRRPKRLVNR
jgi:hypothetical protein